VLFLRRVLLFGIGVSLLGCAPVRTDHSEFELAGGIAVIQTGHSSAITAEAFSADGRLLLSGSEDGTLKLWEVTTGREIRTLAGHSSPITAVCFAPDGRFALSGSDSGGVMLWEVSTGRRMRSFEGQSSRIQSVAFSPAGRSVLFLSDEGLTTVSKWITSARSEVRTLERSYGRQHAFAAKQIPHGPVALSADGRLALSAIANSHDLKLWKISDGSWIRTFKGKKSLVDRTTFAATFSKDGRYVLMRSGAYGQGLVIMETSTGRSLDSVSESLRTKSGNIGRIRAAAISADSRFVLLGNEIGRGPGDKYSLLSLFEIPTGRKVRTFHKIPHRIHTAVFSPDDRFVLTGNDDATLTLWDVATGRRIRTFMGTTAKILSAAYSPHHSFSLCAADDHTLKLWNLSAGQNIRTFRGHTGNVTSVDFSPDGNHAVSGSDDKTVKLWDVSTGRDIQTFRGHSDIVTSVAFSPDVRFVLSGSKDETLKLWDIATGRAVRSFKGHEHWVSSTVFSPDGRYVLSGAKDDILILWDVVSGETIQRFEGHSGDVNAVAISPDGRSVLSGGWRGSLKLWDVATGEEIRTFKGHSGDVTAVAFSPDGHHALAGADHGLIILWRVSDGRKLQEFKGHLGTVTSLAFSSDGRFALSGSKDMTTRIWDIERGYEVVKFMSSSDGEWIIVTPDGYYNTSPEGASLLHWAYPGGLETFTFEQFESRFKKPDIIKARLSGNLEAGVPAPAMTRPPHIKMTDHLAIKETSAKSYNLKLTASALEKVKAVRVFVNGKPAVEVPMTERAKELSLDVPLFAGANRITAVAYDEKGFSSNPKYVDVTCKHRGLTKPSLYIFAVGISDYPRLPSKWQLEFAHTDAKALVEAFKNQEGKLFGEVRFNTLSNKEATVQTINDVLDALSGIDENDLAVVFMAGHGVKAQDSTFYFLTSTGSFDEPQKGGVSWTLLGNYLEKIKGRVILLLDACHSGSIVTETVVPNDELAQQLFGGGHGGVMVFSASKGRQFSLESPDIGGGFGIFTYALTQSLGPKAREADTNNDGFVEFMELVDYVSTYVNKATKGEQTPWLSRKELFGDLPVAKVN
jgi:WD40 repeat protein